jgi:hypothetical protein
MADEDDKAASVKGRTVWDIVVLIISNKSLMTLLVIMFIAALPLSYFGLLSIQYDNGLRIRFGPDPVLRDRDEKKRQQEENAQALRTAHDSLFSTTKGTWSTSVSHDDNTKANKYASCIASFRLQHLLVFNDYNAEENRLLLTYTVQGTYVVNFQRTSDIKDSQYSALRDDCAAAFGVDLIDIGSIADGTAIPYAGRGFGSWHMKFSGEAQLPDAGNNVLVL